MPGGVGSEDFESVESLARQNISWLASQPPWAPKGKGMMWANIPCGDGGDLRAGSMSKGCLPGRGWITGEVPRARGSQTADPGCCDFRRRMR